jgi:hypothetical protein
MRTVLVTIVIAALALSGCKQGTQDPVQIKAFCIDFNWGPNGVNAFTGPGYWADANPAEHVRWYKELGCNTIQTFAVSCNGYAWYKNGVVPEQPGLAHDFLTDMVRLGHENGMKVMGYFCVGANTRWGQEHPDLSYGFPATPHIPFTKSYLDFLSASIRDALQKSGMDGFMVDWVWNPDGPIRWLDCEKEMYRELMNEPFPGKEALTPQQELQFRRKAIDRCWKSIRDAAKGTKPDCVIWLSCNNLRHPDIAGSALLKEIDWIMNEAPDTGELDSLKGSFGENARILQCMVGWGDLHNPKKILSSEKASSINIYGFAAPRANSLPLPATEYLARPIDAFAGNDRNIAVLARYYNQTKLEELKIEPPSFSLVPLGAGDSVEIAFQYQGRTEGVQVHYTVDGSEPSLGSPQCAPAMRFPIPVYFRAATSHNGNMLSGVASFAVSAAFHSPVRLKSQPSGKYPGSGPLTLTDGVLGNMNISSGRWLGFEGESCEAVLDLGKLRQVHELSVGYLVNTGIWIFEPVEIDFALSRDGANFREVEKIKRDPAGWNSEARIERLKRAITPVDTRYVRVTVKNRGTCPPDHPGKGGKAWAFVDEITVN